MLRTTHRNSLTTAASTAARRPKQTDFNVALEETRHSPASLAAPHFLSNGKLPFPGIATFRGPWPMDHIMLANGRRNYCIRAGTEPQAPTNLDFFNDDIPGSLQVLVR